MLAKVFFAARRILGRLIILTDPLQAGAAILIESTDKYAVHPTRVSSRYKKIEGCKIFKIDNLSEGP